MLLWCGGYGKVGAEISRPTAWILSRIWHDGLTWRGWVWVMCRVLLLEAGADPTLLNFKGQSALEVARERGHTACVELIEVRCANLPPRAERISCSRVCMLVGSPSCTPSLMLFVPALLVSHSGSSRSRSASSSWSRRGDWGMTGRSSVRRRARARQGRGALFSAPASRRRRFMSEAV